MGKLESFTLFICFLSCVERGDDKFLHPDSRHHPRWVYLRRHLKCHLLVVCYIHPGTQCAEEGGSREMNEQKIEREQEGYPKVPLK